MKTTTETKPAHRSASFVDIIGSSSHSQPRRGSRAWNRSSLTGTSATRRRSSASEITFDANAANLERTSLFCPLPKKGYGFFYSRAYKEHKKKRKEKKKEHSDEGSSVDDEIPLKRDLTRRKRNSFHKKGTSKDGMGASRRNFEPTNVTAYLAARVESEKPKVKVEYNHSAALVGGSVKPHMMDIALIGRDGASVNSSRFILACYSSVLEEVFFKQRECSNYVQDEPKGNTLTVDFCNESALKAAVHHCFTGELPPEFATPSPSEDVARYLAQLDHLAHVYKFGALGEVTYRALRKLINRRAVLACAIFDELSGAGAGVVDSIKRYSLDTMREMPMDTLLAGGVQWMKEESVEAIMQDQDMDVDEFYMFKILKAWVSADTEVRMPVAKRLSEYIELKFIDSELLKTQVQESGIFTEKEITEAVKLIRDSLANRDPCEMERVLVEGAGTDLVNGIYVRVEEEIGMSEEEILFVKEAEDGYSDVGLYLWGTRWHIAMCADYSNCFYSCDDPKNKPTTELVPGTDWTVQYGGVEPPPYCTYLPNTRMGRASQNSKKNILAPNLEEMMDPTIAEKRRSGYFDKRTDDVIEKRIMTLEQMMNLPEDRGEVREIS